MILTKDSNSVKKQSCKHKLIKYLLKRIITLIHMVPLLLKKLLNIHNILKLKICHIK